MTTHYLLIYFIDRQSFESSGAVRSHRWRTDLTPTDGWRAGGGERLACLYAWLGPTAP